MFLNMKDHFQPVFSIIIRIYPYSLRMLKPISSCSCNPLVLLMKNMNSRIVCCNSSHMCADPSITSIVNNNDLKVFKVWLMILSDIAWYSLCLIDRNDNRSLQIMHNVSPLQAFLSKTALFNKFFHCFQTVKGEYFFIATCAFFPISTRTLIHAWVFWNLLPMALHRHP